MIKSAQSDPNDAVGPSLHAANTVFILLHPVIQAAALDAPKLVASRNLQEGQHLDSLDELSSQRPPKYVGYHRQRRGQPRASYPLEPMGK